jgi:hypothetical protein
MIINGRRYAPKVRPGTCASTALERVRHMSRDRVFVLVSRVIRACLFRPPLITSQSFMEPHTHCHSPTPALDGTAWTYGRLPDDRRDHGHASYTCCVIYPDEPIATACWDSSQLFLTIINSSGKMEA